MNNFISGGVGVLEVFHHWGGGGIRGGPDFMMA